MNYKQISKITIYSIIMGIIAIIGSTIFAIDFPNWIKYDSSFLNDPEIFNDFPLEQLLPVSVQASRAWSAICLIISILMTLLISFEIKKMEKTNYKKYYIYSLGVFTWLMLPYTFYIGRKNKLYSEFWNYLSQDRVEASQISYNSFKKGFTKTGIRDKLFWNTFVAYFLFLVTLVGFVFCFLIPEYIYGMEVIRPINSNELKPGFTVENYYEYSEINLIFEIFSYFTQLSNISCFLFTLSFILFHKKIAFRNNSIMIAISSYIFVVLVIFWTYLFPQGLASNSYIKQFQWVKTSWLHAVTPILFIAFSVSSILISKSSPTTFKRLAINSIIFPLFYGVYIYSLPFYTRFTVYKSLTNMNPNMNPSVGIEGVSKNGNLLMMLGIVGIGLGFVFVFFCFWALAFYNNKKSNQRIGKL